MFHLSTNKPSRRGSNKVVSLPQPKAEKFRPVNRDTGHRSAIGDKVTVRPALAFQPWIKMLLHNSLRFIFAKRNPICISNFFVYLAPSKRD